MQINWLRRAIVKRRDKRGLRTSGHAASLPNSIVNINSTRLKDNKTRGLVIKRSQPPPPRSDGSRRPT
ncbi:hypothetical protein L596_004742 [Steinernema carpocapsae]|uniref:Uncharacterized protein n=1 Tax=Steinernema carpocapsae TaxID=34508 RepID=A0A4U8UXT8_STECR|nr:hypothetical protein L596_004742 [Steinernema carpocapsae]